MNPRSTDALIAALARSAQPVRRVPPLRRQLVAVLALAGGVVTAAVAGLGLRPTSMTAAAPYLSIAVALASGGIAAVIAALAFSRPGRESEGWVALALAAGALLAGGLAGALLLGGTTLADEPFWRGTGEIPCIVGSLVFALPGALLLAWIVGGAAALRPGRAASIAAAGAAALGAFAAHLICRTPGEWHVVVTHAIEPLVGALLLAPLLYAVVRLRERVVLRARGGAAAAR